MFFFNNLCFSLESSLHCKYMPRQKGFTSLRSRGLSSTVKNLGRVIEIQVLPYELYKILRILRTLRTCTFTHGY